MGRIREGSPLIAVTIGIPRGRRTVNGLLLRLIERGTSQSTWQTPMGRIRKDSPIIAVVIGIPRGRRTVNGLLLRLIERGTSQST